MKISSKIGLALLLGPLLLPLGGCGCGFDCNNNGNDSNPALLTLGLSDAVPEDLKQVVIRVDKITFKRTGAEDVVVDRFTIDELGLVDVDTFQVDLLKYQGVNQLRVIQNLSLDPGTYSAVSITIIADGINNSYVQEDNDLLKAITVTGGVLNLPGMQLASGAQPFTIEFSLAQALQATTAEYRLSATGIRVENNLTAATLSGKVDSQLFNSVTPCSEKATPTAGNRVYLYKGTGIASSRLADVYTSASVTTPPANAVAPFAVASLVVNPLTGNWEYASGFVPAGTYTLAFACDTQNDDAVEYNGLTITIPLPVDQIYTVSLAAGKNGTCNLAPGGSC
ncbi:MAG: DUF4382 domain-containing protein [Halioglobus sp.]